MAVLFSSFSSSVSARVSRRSGISFSGLHFSFMLMINIRAVSMHSPGFLQSRYVRSWWHSLHPQFFRPIPEGLTECGCRLSVVFRFANLSVSQTVLILWLFLRHLAECRAHADLY